MFKSSYVWNPSLENSPNFAKLILENFYQIAPASFKITVLKYCRKLANDFYSYSILVPPSNTHCSQDPHTLALNYSKTKIILITSSLRGKQRQPVCVFPSPLSPHFPLSLILPSNISKITPSSTIHIWNN